jgi:hypothetical protein
MASTVINQGRRLMDIIKQMDRSDKWLFLVIGLAVIEMGVQVWSALV